MDEDAGLADRFEAHRARLGAVAYHMLGSPSEADDAVQEAWLRLSRSNSSNIENLGGWLTTVVARVCLDMLQSRREEPVGIHLPEPAAYDSGGIDPEHEALLADSIGSALLVILHTLPPAERLAFVLHDISPSRSATSRQSSGARPPQPGSWPVAPAGGSGARLLFSTPS